MTYDPLGRGTRSTGTGNTDYYYTAAGERILRVDTSGSAYTFRDAGDRIATEYAGITPSRDNVFLGILLVGSYSNSTFASNGPPWLYYSSDHLGTPRLLTDNLGEYVESRRSWPFGEDVASPAPPQPFQRLRYATMERDPEGSRYYDHARSHSFGLARFMSPDKLGGTVSDPQSWNRYTYTLNNPLKYIDPNGQETVTVLPDVYQRLGTPESERAANIAGLAFVAGVTAPIAGAAVAEAGGLSAAWYGLAAAGQRFLNWFGDKAGQAVEEKATAEASRAFDVAAAAGKHAGFLQTYAGRSLQELQKSISSFEKLIAEHQDKMANPATYIRNFSSLDPRQQQALVNSKWPADIARQQEQLEILKRLAEITRK